MVCPTATTLFENYARAAVKLFESADNLGNLLTGQHEGFAKAMMQCRPLSPRAAPSTTCLFAGVGCR
jgi:hypothetical protein